ncbi:transcriptional regulator [Acinetobacter ursingii]|uniref:transcriptional regulator n=1 Tax=Acinetobacter ursingii TaxID=108980 RepID=UPI0032B3FBD8
MSKRPNQADSLIEGDQFVMFRGNCTDYRVLPIDQLLEWVLAKIPTPEYKQPTIQRFNPNGNFTIEIDNNDAGTYLVMNPSIEIQNGTIKLPSIFNVKDGQEILVTSSQQITNLSFDGNGATLVGEPNAMGATAFFKLKYDVLSHTWYRVG